MVTMIAGVFSYLFLLLTGAACVFFVISLVQYIRAKRLVKAGQLSKEELRTKRITLIVSGAVAGLLLAIVIGIVVLLYMALAYM